MIGTRSGRGRSAALAAVVTAVVALAGCADSGTPAPPVPGQQQNTGGSLARHHVDGDVATIAMQPKVKARFSEPQVADHDLFEKIRHDRIAEADFVLRVAEFQPEAGGE